MADLSLTSDNQANASAGSELGSAPGTAEAEAQMCDALNILEELGLGDSLDEELEDEDDEFSLDST
jgi:hypothetical protein